MPETINLDQELSQLEMIALGLAVDLKDEVMREELSDVATILTLTRQQLSGSKTLDGLVVYAITEKEVRKRIDYVSPVLNRLAAL